MRTASEFYEARRGHRGARLHLAGGVRRHRQYAVEHRANPDAARRSHAAEPKQKWQPARRHHHASGEGVLAEGGLHESGPGRVLPHYRALDAALSERSAGDDRALSRWYRGEELL